MRANEPPTHETLFERHRSVLVRTGYQMLGSLSDAEDVVQDAFFRWLGADLSSIEHPRAWLKRVVMRLSLDRLKSAKARREVYVGPWLPEPLIEPSEGATAAHDVSVALMLALERLSPLERAAFLLRDVFDADFEEISNTLGRSASACRQLASRARRRVHEAKPRFAVPSQDAAEIVQAFFSAAQTGDRAALTRLLAEDACLHSDGGGQRLAALNIIHSADHIARFFVGLARQGAGPSTATAKPVRINGFPGLLITNAQNEFETYAFDIHHSRVEDIYIVRNPDKLRHLIE